MKSSHRLQHGFAVIAAVFLVVILATFGAYMVNFSNAAQVTSGQDVQGSRAYWAARAGLEWALVAMPASPALCVSPVAAPPTPIDGFTIAINCTTAPFTDGGAVVKIFQLTSVASLGTPGTPGRVERSVSASVEK